MQILANTIDGEQRPPRSRDYLEVIEPATGEVMAKVPHSDVEDVNDAVDAARRAFGAWSQTPASERSARLLRLADLIDESLEPLAQLESQNCGKPIAAARSVDIPRSAANFRFFATAILHTQGQWHATDTPAVGGPMSAMNYTLRKPRGVAGLISPWNLPLYLLTWKIAPAIAAGCTCVCKPSEVTPATAAALGELCGRAGLPPGVVNIVHGAGAHAGAALVKHDDVTTLSFTGSTAVGRWIGREAGERLKRVSLELGGKNPLLLFPDADLDEALETIIRAAFSNQGQICLCSSRLLVHRSILPAVRERLVAMVKALVPGDPSLAATRFGALTSRQHLEKVESLVEQARALGGRVLTGGSRVEPLTLPERCRRGFFYLPTVIEGLDPHCAVEREEIFGPVLSVQAFDDEDHAVALANGTSYGLSATILTRDLARAHRLARRIDAGVIWINCWMVRDLRTPFGGVKASGVGREGGDEALRFFTEPANICIRL
jgi:aminomuconate-semialdehyde/2-hydroxymuconate-6-semialdehyde dehydrogenase